MAKAYIQQSGKVVEAGSKFEHVMAIALDPRSDNREGVIRCITGREGDVQFCGYIDRSRLFKIQRVHSSPEKFEITDPLKIRNEQEIINKLADGGECIGFEDPDIWIDEQTGLTHLYFTIPIMKKMTDGSNGCGGIDIHLGHAVGKDLDSLDMTEPVLLANDKYSAKEVSVAPLNSKGFRYNLIESSDARTDWNYSTVQAVIAQDMGKPWEYGDILFHPGDSDIPWIKGHASPGPLLPEAFLDLGPGRRLGLMNGREANQKMPDGSTKLGMFSTGLFIYDYENGKIEWVSSEPLIKDSEAVTITFASQFVLTGPGKGILYAHVDDSFVRAYDLSAEGIKDLLPVKSDIQLQKVSLE